MLSANVFPPKFYLTNFLGLMAYLFHDTCEHFVILEIISSRKKLSRFIKIANSVNSQAVGIRTEEINNQNI